ncbi:MULTISPECIES: hypothetical protein [Bacteroides]|uniref:hypothetical protein n=1 Tax=Bacteroides TaxID=816 RepID=UPI001D014449|nr:MULTISPECIES: hypothetical protein [Bacteroides]MDY4226898.1 hypothetical protein [Bacteroides uniformis]UDB43262.1 hypothetical protein JXR92_012895 [Bacteroides humanifaecis]UDL10899.1 hypothetical protein LIX30_12915 [Bacteroides humanifaecis]
MEGKIEDEVYEVIADTFISDRIDLYVSFQEAQDGELPDDDFLPGAENTGFLLYTRLGVMERLILKAICFTVCQSDRISSPEARR